MSISLVLVALVAIGVFGVGFWLSAPVGFWWRWVLRGVLGGVVVALLAPAGWIQGLQDWVKGWLPVAASASQAPGADWVIHFLSFAGLGALLFHLRRDISVVWMGAGLIVFGGVTEVLQVFVDGRTASFADFVADGVGVAVGYFVARGVAARVTQF